MSIGSKIAFYRKKLNITQENLAQQLQVTNQAVSKWESDQCCPDIQLLPRLADIFGITIDELFDRESAQAPQAAFPWEDDETLRVLLYRGHKLVASGPAEAGCEYEYDEDVQAVISAVSVQCGNVAGDVVSAGNVSCDDVAGHVHAVGDLSCDNIDGNVTAGGNIACDEIAGSATAGGNITCDEICGNATAAGAIHCDEIGGSAKAGGSINQGSSMSFHFGSDADTQDDTQKGEKKGFIFRF